MITSTRFKRQITIVLASVAAALALAACGSSSNSSSSGGGGEASTSEDPIVIGAAIGKTGLLKAYDVPGLTAAQIAVDEVNEEGGILGRPVKIISSDTGSDPQRGPAAAQEVIDQGATWTFASADFDLGSPAAITADSQGILALSLYSNEPQWGPEAIGPLAFTFNTSTAAMGAANAEFALEEGWKTAFVLTDTLFTFARQECSAFKQAFEKGGGKVVGEATFQQEDPSVATQITQMKGASPAPQAIVLCSLPPGAATALKQMRGAGLDQPVLGSDAMDGDYWLKSVPNLSDVYIPVPASKYLDDPDPAVNKFFETVEEVTGEPALTGQVVGAYSAIQGVQKAAEEAGTTDSEAVAEKLNEFTAVKLLSGPTTFTVDQHVPAEGRSVRIIQIQDGVPSYLTSVTPKYIPTVGTE